MTDTVSPQGFVAGFGRLLLAGVVAGCLLFSAQASAASITGFSDESLAGWGSATWSAFEATGVKQVRHAVAWNVALPGHSAELAATEHWVEVAQAHGLEVLISFNHAPLPCDRSLPSCEFPASVLAPTASEYLNAVGKFRENPKFSGISSYTAWNEPNHHVAPVSHPAQDANPGSFPGLAGEYWVNMNFVCHLAKYGPNCTVTAGDFLDGEDATGLSNYMNSYKAAIAESGVTPSAWAVHPYHAVESGDWSVIDSGFIPKVESKPVWFTEVGGLVCKPGVGYVAGSLAGSLEVQNTEAGNLLSLISHEGSRIQRSYYYSLAFPSDSEPTCAKAPYVWDSVLLGGAGSPRPAYKTLFPGAVKAPSVQTTASSSVQGTQATLNGTVNPNGFNTSYRMEYGTTSAYGSSAPVPDAAVGFGRSAVAESMTVTGLQPGASYHYRIVASNAAGTSYGSDASFTTAPGIFFSDAPNNGSISYWAWGSSTGGWQQSFLFGHAVAAGTSPVTLTYGGLPHVFFVDAARGNQITEWSWSSATSWQQTFISTDPVAAHTSPSAVVVNGEARVFFADASTANSIAVLTKPGATWQQTHFLGDAVAAGSSPSAIVNNGSAQVYFADAAHSSTISVWNWSPTLLQMSSFFGDAVAAGSSPSAIVNNGSAQVYFADAAHSSTISVWNWSPTLLQMSSFFGDAVAAGSSPSAIVNNGSAQVYFADAAHSNTISVWNWSPTLLQMSSFFGDAVAAGSSPSAIVNNGSAQVYFVDAAHTNSLSYWEWTTTLLQQIPLFGHAVAAESSPSH